MKKIILVLVFALLAMPAWADSLNPPKGNCKKGEVYKCIMAGCMSTLRACPEVYEDGKLMPSDCSNQTTCNWDCSCVKKDVPDQKTVKETPYIDLTDKNNTVLTLSPMSEFNFVMGSVGKLSIENEELKFTGNADAAAKIFFEYLKEHVDAYIKQELKKKEKK
jgi:hypothetical protein